MSGVAIARRPTTHPALHPSIPHPAGVAQFRALLATKFEEGAFTAKAKWRDVVEMLTPTDAYRAAVEQATKVV